MPLEPSQKVIAIETLPGPFADLLERVINMVPDRDRNDTSLRRLLAFRLRIDGEAGVREYLIRKIRAAIKCGYTGAFYDFITGDITAKGCHPDDESPGPRNPPEVA